MTAPKKPKKPGPKKRDPSEYGGDSDPDNQNPKEPSQEELDEDMRNNPDTSKPVDGSERDGGGG